MPRARAFFTTSDPTWPTPTTPTRLPARVAPRSLASVSHAAIMYSATAFALQPSAAWNAMPSRSRSATATWSDPEVAVPTNRTGVPAKSAASTRVMDRTISRSTSPRSACEIRRPCARRTSPKVPNASRAHGMFSSARITGRFMASSEAAIIAQRPARLPRDPRRRLVWSAAPAGGSCLVAATRPYNGRAHGRGHESRPRRPAVIAEAFACPYRSPSTAGPSNPLRGPPCSPARSSWASAWPRRVSTTGAARSAWSRSRRAPSSSPPRKPSATCGALTACRASAASPPARAACAVTRFGADGCGSNGGHPRLPRTGGRPSPTLP